MYIAFLTCTSIHSDTPDRGADGREHDLEFTALQREGAKRGMVFEEVIWDAPDTDWTRYKAAMVGTTWDYPLKCAAFFDTLAQIDQQTMLVNPLALMRWNLDKIYLCDLAKKGVRSIPVVWADAANCETIKAAFDKLKSDEIVIKPRIGAHAWRQIRLKRGEALPPPEDLPPDTCFMQPFLPSVAKYGEVTMLYYEGVFSHAARKIPAQGEYRVQSSFGAQEVCHEPDAQEIASAEAALAALPIRPVYARIDLVRDLHNKPAIMEVELIEPYHYVEQGPGFSKPLIDALMVRLG